MDYRALEAGRFGAGSPFDWPVAIGYERSPFASLPIGGFATVAGPVGVAIGIFGWVNAAGEVSNAMPIGAPATLVFVLPTRNGYNWQRVYPSLPALCAKNLSGYPSDPYQNPAPFPLQVIRSGIETIVSSTGTYDTRFPLGATVGSTVWVDPLTGLAYDSNATGTYVQTKWIALASGAANAVVRISSLVSPIN